MLAFSVLNVGYPSAPAAAPSAPTTQTTQITPAALKTVPMIPVTKPAVANPVVSPGIAIERAFTPNTMPKIDKTNATKHINGNTEKKKEPMIPKIPHTRAAMEKPFELLFIILPPSRIFYTIVSSLSRKFSFFHPITTLQEGVSPHNFFPAKTARPFPAVSPPAAAGAARWWSGSARAGFGSQTGSPGRNSAR